MARKKELKDVLVDPEDEWILEAYDWRIDTDGHVVTGPEETKVYLCNVIMNQKVQAERRRV